MKFPKENEIMGEIDNFDTKKIRTKEEYFMEEYLDETETVVATIIRVKATGKICTIEINEVYKEVYNGGELNKLIEILLRIKEDGMKFGYHKGIYPWSESEK